MAAPAVGAASPFVLDGVPEPATGGPGREVDKVEHIVLPVLGQHPAASAPQTLGALLNARLTGPAKCLSIVACALRARAYTGGVPSPPPDGEALPADGRRSGRSSGRQRAPRQEPDPGGDRLPAFPLEVWPGVDRPGTPGLESPDGAHQSVSRGAKPFSSARSAASAMRCGWTWAR